MRKIFFAIAIIFTIISSPKLFAQENRFNGTGNAGIGTGATTPASRLVIQTTDTTINNIIEMEHKGMTNTKLFLGTASAVYPVLLQRKANILESYTDLHISTANTGKIFFETGRTDANAPIRMTLTNTGLGIGTTTPATSLHVNSGNIRLTNPGPYPHGVNIDVNFTGNWAREYSISYNTSGKLFSWGVYGTNGIINYAYIGGNTTADEAHATPWMAFKPDGNIGIGTTTPGTYKLAVEGTIGARKVKVTQATWADFVFLPDYQLPSLGYVEQFIKQNQHLPDVPSAAEVEKEGQDLGEMNKTLLQKVEELTLYLIDQQKQLKSQQEQIGLLQEQNELLLKLVKEKRRHN